MLPISQFLQEIENSMRSLVSASEFFVFTPFFQLEDRNSYDGKSLLLRCSLQGGRSDFG